MYLYLKALHIIFIVTWFAGLFYFPRLLIYHAEANEKKQEEKFVLQQQLEIMMKRLWYGITWPSALLTLIFGLSVLFKGNWTAVLFDPAGKWLLVKLIFVVFLYVYHLSLQWLYNSQVKGVFRFSSSQLRGWNEIATIFLVAIVMLATVKESVSFLWGLAGLVVLIVLLLLAIKIYRNLRTRR